MARLKLSTASSRAELIAAYGYAAAPPPPAKAPVGGDGKPAPAVSDDNATGKTYEPEPYHEDPDETVICPSCQKHNDTDAVFCDQCGFQLKGADDVKLEPAGEAPAPAKAPAPAPAKPAVTAATSPPVVVPKPAGTAKTPNASPVDESGNIDGAAVCTNPDCQHLASSHLNDDSAGQNTGACQMTDCACLGMAVEAAPNTGAGGDQGAQGAQPSDDSQELALAPPIVSDAPTPPGPAKTVGSELNEPPPVPGGENMGPAFTIPVLIIEGQPTGDGRQIAPGALTWRVPPLPLMGLATETHDPEGFDMNDPAVICGRIDSLERVPGEGDTQLIMAHGFYLANDDGMYFAALTEAMGRCGISGDVNPKETEVSSEGMDDDGWPIDMTMTIVDGEILGATQVPFPAFAGAYIVLGDGEEKPAAQAIPQQAEAPVVPAKPPAAVTAGGQLVHLMSYEECSACEQGLDVILASGAGPSAPPKAWFQNPNFTQGDGRLSEILDRRGERAIGGKFACPLTITDDGRVYGHLAPWGVCHIGKPGCVTAPQSKSDYAYFKRGQHVVTAEGEKVRVGTLTVNAGHADVHASSAGAMAHYDNIATAAADVNCGEDEYGIWIAGAIRPTASAEQIAALRASSISGDWRGLGGSLELVAALAVPVPGFPHAIVAGAVQEALVAAGAGAMHRLKHPVIPESEPGDVKLRAALAPLLDQARASARERLAAQR